MLALGEVPPSAKPTVLPTLLSLLRSSLAPVTKEGYVIKRGNIGWKRRYAVLHDTTFYFFRDQTV